MQTFTKSLEIHKYFGKLFDLYYGDLDICTFDIETTGLFPAHDRIMLSGMLKWEDSSECVVTQYFDDTGMDEEKLIRATITFLKSSDLIVTYNGRSFDLPFLKRRAKKYNIDYTLPSDLDLFLLAQGYSDIKSLTGSLRQVSVERFMGVADKRTDRIHGGLSVDMYKEYLALGAAGSTLDREVLTPAGTMAEGGLLTTAGSDRATAGSTVSAASGDDRARELLGAILLHNSDDVAQLARILPLCGRTDFSKFCASNGFPADAFQIENIDVNKTGLTVTARYTGSSKLTGPVSFVSQDDGSDRPAENPGFVSGQVSDASDPTVAMLPDYISFPTEDQPYHLTVTNDGITPSMLTATFPSFTVTKGVEAIDAARILTFPAADNGQLANPAAGNDQLANPAAGKPLSEIEKYPAFSSGYLVLRQNGKINYLETNLFVQQFLKTAIPHILPY